ncbi:hypothetical protein [Streptomyces sp. 769]|uniref:hypothetical protein n=1 Tax=Streptomyces sp. 769 TaxID=1262452 RepID=UPI00057F0124|nr:hypothetical protein [Streptomyces sp. 769]AJC60637.1 hypothetical protein GZL_08089 [Streptomyces sp. 769]
MTDRPGPCRASWRSSPTRTTTGYLKHLTDRILPGVESRRDGARAADRPDVAAAYAEVAHLMLESVQALRNVAEGLGEGLGERTGEGPVVQEERQAG